MQEDVSAWCVAEWLFACRTAGRGGSRDVERGIEGESRMAGGTARIDSDCNPLRDQLGRGALLSIRASAELHSASAGRHSLPLSARSTEREIERVSE